MKIFLASGAPGNDSVRKEGLLLLPRRLLSYYHIYQKQLECDKIFQCIKKEK